MARDKKKERDEERRRNARLKGEIRKFDDPILAQTCLEVAPDENLDFLRRMRQVCLATTTGVGLAAPQIGILKRAIFIKPHRLTSSITSCHEWLLNPEILDHSEETDLGIEGCLSYPGYSGMVERWQWIKLRYLSVSPGEILAPKETIKIFKDWEARVVMHELQHLFGICVVRRFWESANNIHHASIKLNGLMVNDYGGVDGLRRTDWQLDSAGERSK